MLRLRLLWFSDEERSQYKYKMPRPSSKQFPARLDDMLIDDTAEVELSAPSSPSGRERNTPRQAGARRSSSSSSSPSRETRSKTPHKKHLWVPPPLTIPETNPRQPVKLTTLSSIIKDNGAPEEAKGTALFEMAIHSEKGQRKFEKARAKALTSAPDSQLPEFVQVADEYISRYRQHRPRIYRHSYHTGLCDAQACNDALLVPHIFYFPCAVQSLYDAINDPGFTPWSVPCQAALFTFFPYSWPVFCCAQAYVLRSKLNLILGVRESYHVFAKSFFCPCCLTASMHREIELRRVPVLIRSPFSSAPAQRVYESEVLAPDIAHMGACGELVIPLPSLNEHSIKSSSKTSTLPPPSAEYGSYSLCYTSAPYNSFGHALLIALSAAPYLALTFSVGPFALMYHCLESSNGNCNCCSSTSNSNTSNTSQSGGSCDEEAWIECCCDCACGYCGCCCCDCSD